MERRIRCFLLEPVEGSDTLWRRADTGEEMTLDEAPAGAMWFAYWMDGSGLWCNPGDGRSLIVKTPGGEWYVDGPCSNCTRRDEPHQCWVRHGVAPDVTVDKNGNTCSAGAGSISKPNYHGFLRGGYLEEC